MPDYQFCVFEMPDYSIFALGESQISISGGGQLDGVNQGNGSHLDGLQITLNAPAWEEIQITDNDPDFEDSDGNQVLNGAQNFDGVAYADGLRVEAEYGLTLSDGVNTWQLVGFNINNSNPNFGTVEGLAFIGGPGGFPPLGVPLTVVSSQEGPSYLATEYATPICFASGTRIATTRGLVAVEDIRAGDLVQTRDSGPQPVIWHSMRHLPGVGPYAPVRIGKGIFGAGWALRVSPPHRILIRSQKAELLFGAPEVFVAASHLVGQPGITRPSCREISYHHLLLERHEVILADGVWSESLFAGADEAQPFFGSAKVRFSGPLARPVLKRHEARMLLEPVPQDMCA